MLQIFRPIPIFFSRSSPSDLAPRSTADRLHLILTPRQPLTYLSETNSRICDFCTAPQHVGNWPIATYCTAARVWSLTAILATLGAQGITHYPEVQQHISIDIALHYGDAAYGNIGSGNRLDFTAVGRDINILSRLELVCKDVVRPLLMTGAFAAEVRCRETKRRGPQQAGLASDSASAQQ